MYMYIIIFMRVFKVKTDILGDFLKKIKISRRSVRSKRYKSFLVVKE